jgi:hypothetical protein
MTRRSYPKVAHGPIVACPCCRRELEVRAYFDGDVFALDDMHLHAELVPLREQPCVVFVHRYECDPKLTAPGGFIVGWKHNVRPSCDPFRRGYRPGGACNWLGPTCNDASHVTPVTPEWGPSGTRCTPSTGARRSPRLARCVH